MTPVRDPIALDNSRIPRPKGKMVRVVRDTPETWAARWKVLAKHVEDESKRELGLRRNYAAYVALDSVLKTMRSLRRSTPQAPQKGRKR